MNINKYFIIDFDSTFVTGESLEDLARLVLKDNPKKDQILHKIKEITSLGMEGKIDFNKSLSQRLALIQANKSHLEELIKILKKKISPSIARNRKFFREFNDNIYIISGGFKEFVYPVVQKFGIKEPHVLANDFVFDNQGQIIGFNKTNPLAQKNGKVKAVNGLKLKGEIHIIGDGYTDYEIKKMDAARKFTAFTENIVRESIVEKADIVAPNFDEFLYINKLPMQLSYPKNRIKILMLENIDNTAVTNFEKEGFKVEYYKKSFEGQELIQKLKDISVLGIRSRTNVNKEIMRVPNRLLTIGAFCIGVEQVDLKKVAYNGIAVFNAPYSNTRSVVELAIGDMIMLERGAVDKSNKAHRGIWDKAATGSNEIRGKKLGIVGYGNIGTQLSVIAESLGMDVYFYDLVEKLALGNAKKCASLPELLKKSDIVSIHVDGRRENHKLIGEREFKLMKNGVVFLNLSRGSIVDYEALAKALKSGKVKGAAVDVYPVEPKSADDKLSTPLQGVANVILTPHIGGSTIEAQASIAEFVSTKIIEYINTGNTYMSVNIPNIQLQEAKHAHRMLHLHKNIPGILAQINGVMAVHKINILGQYLKTNEDIGYVITDIDKKYDKTVIEELKKIPETIRFRLLY